MGIHELRWRLVDGPDSWGAHRRAQRARWLAARFPALADMAVIDLGGRVETWEMTDVRPRHVHVVNIEAPPRTVPEWAEVDAADVCALPDRIMAREYDLVFSNSVIEHLGGHERRLRFSEAVHSLATAYWVQTPYRFFPIEPHWVAPGMQFLPTTLRTTIAKSWPLGHTPPGDRTSALDSVLWTDLLDRTQMRHYFPDATLVAERVLGLTKSIVAVRQ